MRRVWLISLAALALTACGGPAATGGGSFVDQACAGTSFGHCREDVEFALDTYPSGTQVAICDAGDGSGSVVFLGSGGTAQEACTEDAIDPGAVLRVVLIP